MSFFRKLGSEDQAPDRIRFPLVEPPPSALIPKNFPMANLMSRPQGNIRVNFNNRALSRVVKSVRSLDSTTPDPVTVVNTAQILSDLKIEKEPAISFKTTVDFVGINYVGYVIEKERLDKRTGKWLRIDEYRIIGSQANSFKDSRVAYGNCYRYRIRSVIKVTNSITKESFETFELVENVRRQERDRVKKQLRLKEDIIASVSRIVNVGLRSKSSKGVFNDESTRHSKGRDGNRRDLLSLSEGLKLNANSRKTEVVSVPVPGSRRDMGNLRRMKNLRVKDSRIADGTIGRGGLQKQINETLRQFRESTVEYVSYYYESEPSEDWQYVDISENVPPPAPSSIKIVPNSLKREIGISWLKPPNSQRDIKFFRLYRRNRVGRKWTLLTENEQHINFYIDRNVNFDKQYIYALTCVDAHGYESFMSIQTEAQLNRNYVAEGREKPLKWISGGGTAPDEIDVVLKRFQDSEKPIIAKRNFLIRPTKEFNEPEKKLIIRVTSLDTHEKKEFNITLKNVNIKEVQR